MPNPTPQQLQSASLDDLLALASGRFEVVFEPVAVDGHRLDIVQIADMSAYVDRLVAAAKAGESVSLPFWAKLWPSNIILAYYLNRMELAPGARVLEIGAGGGLAGLVTALRGAPTVLSDVDDNALLFCRINALKNGLGDAVEVRRVDFTTERPEDRFEYVVGCEVLYQEDVYRPLVKFLAHTLAPTPGSQVVLARDYARRARRFFKLADRDFAITEKTIGCKAAGESGEPERHLICISRLTPRRGQAERERPEPDHAGGDA